MRYDWVVYFARGTVVALIATLFAISASAQSPPTGGDDAVLPVLDRLSITLPPDVASHRTVRPVLETLGRERCDEKAIGELGDALDKLGYRREAASAHISFSEGCGGKLVSLRRATNILLGLNDYVAVITIADDIIRLEPFQDNGYFLRAVGRDRRGETRGAIDDYLTAIELFPEKQKISSISYTSMARNYAKLGQFCDAASAVNSWVSINPVRNDNSQVRAMIAEYTSKGNCDAGTSVGKEEVFARAGGNVVRLQATVNGVTGTFILDTGASFVALRQSFARKANVAVDTSSSVQLHTANGIAQAHRGRAATIKVRSLSAKDVAVVVQSDDRGSYGPGVDGLLGMTFLSHFKISIDPKSVRLSKR